MIHAETQTANKLQMEDQKKCVARTWPLITGAEYKRGDSFGQRRKYSFIALPGKGGSQQANASKTLCPIGEMGGGLKFGEGKIGPQIRIRIEASLHCFQSWTSVDWRSFRNKDCINSIRLLGGLVLQKNKDIFMYIP